MHSKFFFFQISNHKAQAGISFLQILSLEHQLLPFRDTITHLNLHVTCVFHTVLIPEKLAFETHRSLSNYFPGSGIHQVSPFGVTMDEVVGIAILSGWI